MNKKLIFSALIIFTVALSLSSVNAGMFDFLSSNTVEVNNLEMVSKGYYMYDVNCELTPKSDFSYLEMTVIFYDSDGAVIEKNPIVWNMNDVTKDQLIKVNGNAYLTNQKDQPAYAEIFITDSPFNGDVNDAIYTANVTM
ncbi:MAG: hypothetical protein E7Z85_04225 [Methanosphaera stadtmanae]|jgi:hypothetical protein|nr:hypothetical protein [Methanosphaera stadtmanae]